jgi:HEPN domain-containing protein
VSVGSVSLPSPPTAPDSTFYKGFLAVTGDTILYSSAKVFAGSVSRAMVRGVSGRNTSEVKFMNKIERELNVDAARLYAMAIRYAGAANRLYSLSKATGKGPHYWPWSHPIHFLYFHAIELALKAYLRSHKVSVKRTHRISTLYQECRSRGLQIRRDDGTDIANVVNLLESNNEGAGFRYYDPDAGGTLPELSWTRYETNGLMSVVGRDLRRLGFTMKPTGRVARLGLTVSRPEKQS